ALPSGGHPRALAARAVNHQTRYYLTSPDGIATLILGGGQASEGHRAMAIIEARGLARTFKSRQRMVEAVRGVDLTVGEGEIVGFLGPNGAAKTTTLRMLTTLLKPTAGTATVAGADLLSNPLEVRKKIGYVPQAIGETMGGTDPSCLVIEELLDQAALYRIGGAQARQRAELLIDQLELTGLEQRLVKTPAGGHRGGGGIPVRRGAR